MTNDRIQRARLYIGSFVACVVLTVLSIAFVDRAVSSWSHAVLRRPAPLEWLTHIIDPFVPAASVALISVAIAALFGWRPRPLGRTLIALCIAVLIATILKEELKYLFGRTWPETWIDKNPSWIHDGVYRFEPLHGGKGWASFPSGHMTVITAPCTVLWMLASRVWRWLWAALILAVAVGLVASDYHFIGDMIGGTFLGWACGVGAVALTAGLVMSEKPEHVAQTPGEANPLPQRSPQTRAAALRQPPAS
jgi:membrane-associated phospholipid phosphatase